MCWACGSAPQAATVAKQWATVAKQWATMLGELRNRGLADALIVCCDGMGGLPESIRATWPDATADLRRAHGAQQPPLRLAQALGPDHQSHARDLHSTHRRGRRSLLRGLRPRLGRHLPGNDPVLATVLGRVRAAGGVPRRAAPDRLHHQRRREPQRPVPTSCKTPRALTATSKPP